jgi:arylsulfatase A-like enzyme
MNSKASTTNKIEHVILISYDSLRSDYIAALSDEEISAFALMKREGAFFENAIVQAPMTIPSHCSMLTGLYPANTGVRDMHHQLPSEVPSVFNLLQKGGIYTISVASTHMLKSRKITGIDVHLKLSLSQLSKTLKSKNASSSFSFIHYWDTHTPYETQLPAKSIKDVILNMSKPLKMLENIKGGERVNDFLELQRVNRIRYLLKHKHPRIIEAAKKGYINSIKTADKFLANTFNTMKKLDLYEKTLFIVMGDHGDSFNEHNEIDRQPDLRYEHGHFLYDNILKVPLIFFWPGQKVGKHFKQQVELIDLTPTILDSLNVKCDHKFDGLSLIKAINGDNDQKFKPFVFSEVVRESRDLSLRSVRTNKTKLIKDDKTNKFELFDLVKDPAEQNNLWPQDPHSEKSVLLEELEEFSKIDSKETEETSDADKEKIEKALKDLGYM